METENNRDLAKNYIEAELISRGYNIQNNVLHAFPDYVAIDVITNTWEIYASNSTTGDEQYWEMSGASYSMTPLRDNRISTGDVTPDLVLTYASVNIDEEVNYAFLDSLIDQYCNN